MQHSAQTHNCCLDEYSAASTRTEVVQEVARCEWRVQETRRCGLENTLATSHMRPQSECDYLLYAKVENETCLALKSGNTVSQFLDTRPHLTLLFLSNSSISSSTSLPLQHAT